MQEGERITFSAEARTLIVEAFGPKNPAKGKIRSMVLDTVISMAFPKHAAPDNVEVIVAVFFPSI